jgi:hypothetical protein
MTLIVYPNLRVYRELVKNRNVNVKHRDQDCQLERLSISMTVQLQAFLELWSCVTKTRLELLD